MQTAAPDILKEIKHRKTFAIISHPDAGKTTITEKLLLFGEAIQMAGMVKAKRAKQFATSDWMEIEKQRGISVASSVMQFSYDGYNINLLDTPGHADFSEDTYRVLTAVDAALMVIDSAKGIEDQTKKLFQVCRDRQIPIVTFMNKMDREAKDPFDLIDEVEKELELPCSIMTWPVGMGDRFKGVYDLHEKCMRVFDPGVKTKNFNQKIFKDVSGDEFKNFAGDELAEKLQEDLELIQGASQSFDRDRFLKGEISPVFFGSALNNFGVQELLHAFLKYAPSPLPRPAETRLVHPEEKNFTGLVFKIQANMDPRHRDRCAFIRVCSGVFEPGQSVYHNRLGRNVKLNNAVQFMSKERTNIEKAVAGDIIGIIDRGTMMIGDTLSSGEALRFTGVPQFSPDLFSLVELKNPIKMKQLQKGLEQLAEEGSSQLFRRKYNSDNIIGVVGRLQFEVVKYRLLNEYGADAIFTSLGYSCSRWYRADDPKVTEKFEEYYQNQIVFDVRGYPMILLKDDWEQNYIQEKNPEIRFFSSLLNYEADRNADRLETV
ncbi:MAG: peptide chain release factor 3 [Deltaproteobacteria bacterium]|nr:peptide chain release factor 3 [Deltaproteobacteria bacterium]